MIILIFCYILIYIGVYASMRDLYLEEHNKKILTWYQSVAILLGSLTLFFGLFLLMAIYTLKYPPHVTE